MDIVSKGQQRATIWNIPNLLTSFRIFSIPVIVVLLTSPGPLPSFLAALVFTVAAITDFLDGYFARLHKGETALGKLLDPMADKLLILSGMI